MSKSKIIKSKQIEKVVKTLPFFTIDSLMPIEKNKDYLKVLFYRLSKRGKIIPLKRGLYTSSFFLENIEKKNIAGEYSEFIANIIYEPSYLSLEYVLEKYGTLTETVNSFTLVTEKKTNKFFNDFGIFNYYHIKKELFNGFKIVKKNNFLIAEASLAKALFDFLYFRKNILLVEKQIEELRLNMDSVSKKDFKEFKKYVEIEGSKKMKKIFDYLIKKNGKSNFRVGKYC
jgi:predicted transcriptional regulator of viral defense system